MASVWEEFGIAVAKARAAKKWTLSAVAEVAFGNVERKGYVSQIEKGRTKLHFSTVQKLAAALGLPESVTDPVYRADLPAEDIVAEEDRTAERLMRVSEADASIAPPSEALLISLAYEFARGSHVDLMTAHNGLKAALQVAADLKARGMLPQNTSDQVTTLMRRVAQLNDQGLRDEAATEVDTALADLDASHAAQESALLDIGIRQDRVRNNPASAAKRILARLRLEAHPGGLFRAIHSTWEEWYDRGFEKGLTFDLTTALHLARANLDRSNGVQRTQALADLGITQYRLGEKELGTTRLAQAIATWRTFLVEHPRKNNPEDWALGKGNLGIALESLGVRESSTARLEEAIIAYRAALEVQTRDRVPLDWAMTQNNLGTALTTLGEREPGTLRLEEAVAAHRSALEERTRDRVPLDWATTQNNLGNALWRWGEREPGTARLQEAVAAYRAALEEHTRDRVPLNWATSWGNMGEALTVLADRTDDLAMARQALQQLQEAEAVLRGGGHETFATYSADRIPRAKAVIARLSQVGVQA